MRTAWPTRWTRPLFSQQTARRNAQQAAIRLAHRRAQREDAERFLRELVERRERASL
jgi:hypothetical protein